MKPCDLCRPFLKETDPHKSIIFSKIFYGINDPIQSPECFIEKNFYCKQPVACDRRAMKRICLLNGYLILGYLALLTCAILKI